MTNLKPCPFCGGEAAIRTHLFTGLTNTHGAYCKKCGAQTEQFCDTEAEAAEAWNSRADGWISVKDRLPEHCNHVDYDGEGWDESNPVAVIARYGTDESMGIGLYSGNNEWYGSTINDIDLDACIVTYWMPLPEQPKEAQDE